VLTTEGVFNNNDSIKEGVYFLPEKIKLIDKLVQETNASIVVLNNGRSSIAFKDRYLVYNEIFKNLGLSRGLAGYYSRDSNLAEFLADKIKTNKVVVISANQKYAKLGKSNFYLTNYNRGLTEGDIDMIKLLIDL
jgi:hypothetical protein